MAAFRLPSSWPEPADMRAAGIFAERLHDAAQRLSPAQGAGAVLARRELRALVACLGGNSPYLADLACREIETLLALIAHGPDPVAASALRSLATSPAAPRPEITATLRRAKRQVALATAFADLGGIWTLEQVTGALSDLAEAALRLAADHLLLEAGDRHALPIRDRAAPWRGAGFAIIGMGKLGAHELNYSSDIDLVLLHDPGAHGMGEASAVFSRLARDLVALMETRDADGYVFRVDLRLRPDPATTPPVVALPMALAYYESLGETWERAAFSKARPVAGDLALGARFLDTINPFIWRRHLDFAAIEEMRAMKARIDRSRGTRAPGADARDAADPVAALLGRDLKLGWGGIREIEFTAQTMQLVWGGRLPSLRARDTIGALASLAASGHLAPADATTLTAAYRALRTAEHRLQMVADRQTHALPPDRVGFEAFARFMGEADGAALARRLRTHMARVHAIFEKALFDPAEANAIGREAGRDWTDPAVFAALGFARPDAASAIVRRWLDSPPRALRHARASRLLASVLDTLIPAIGRQLDPDASLIRFDRLVEKLRAGLQVLALLARNPTLIERIADLLGASPSLADHLASVPSALEGLLAREDVDPAPRRTLAREIAGRRDRRSLDVVIDTARRFVRGEEFRLALAELEGRLDVDVASRARTAIADAVLATLLARVGADHRARYGTVGGGGLVIVALGKAGSREMMGGSDLDLMLVYDHAPDAAESRSGERALVPATYYNRLAQSLISAITAPGVEGALYACDMRLRPSGRQGPVAVSLASFRSYHRTSAWTWERMALTRARVVAGPATLRRTVADAITEALDRRDDPATLRRDAAAMRVRLLRDRKPEGVWDVKLRDGGLMETEFIAQLLQLGPVPHACRSTSTGRAFRGLARAGILPTAEARRLAEADRFWRRIQSLLRIVNGQGVPRGALPPGVGAALERVFGTDMPTLEAQMEAEAATVRAAFERWVGPPLP